MNNRTKLYIEWLSLKSAEKEKYREMLNRINSNTLTEEDLKFVQRLESCFF